jgi:hypothetical protein
VPSDRHVELGQQNLRFARVERRLDVAPVLTQHQGVVGVRELVE